MSLSLAPSAEDDAKLKGSVSIEEVTQQAGSMHIGAAEASAAASSDDAAASAASAASSSAAAPSAPSSSLRDSFVLLPDTCFAKDSNDAVRRYYSKWDIQPTCHMHRWRYTQAVDLSDPAAVHSFLVSLTNSASFRFVFQRYDSAARALAPLPSSAGDVVRVAFKPVPAQLTDLHLFDRLWTEAQPPIVHGDVEDPLPNLEQPAAKGKGGAAAAALAAAEQTARDDASGSGGIRKCFEDVVDGVPVADELRRCLLDRDSDQFELFTLAERQQLLFILLVHLCVGGGLCQYENNVGPYLSVLRLLYRDLVSVRTNRNTDALEIHSRVLRVTDLLTTNAATGAEQSVRLFGDKEKDKHHLCLFSIDAQKRHVTSYFFAHTQAW